MDSFGAIPSSCSCTVLGPTAELLGALTLSLDLLPQLCVLAKAVPRPTFSTKGTAITVALPACILLFLICAAFIFLVGDYTGVVKVILGVTKIQGAF